MGWIKNGWYAVGVSQLLTKGVMLKRTILEERVVLFRAEDGSPVALRDRCPHRFAPLSMGRLQGALITCGYHGLQFNAQGRCVHNPHGAGSIPSAATVHSYPILDRYGFTWIWMGSPEAADQTKIPDLSILDRSPTAATTRGTFHSSINYLLQLDNLLDISHVDFLHTWFETGGLSSARPHVSEVSEKVTSLWTWKAEQGYGLHKDYVGATPVDSYMEAIWQAPSTVILLLSSVAEGKPRADGVGVFAVHLLTPESDRAVHYSYALTRNFALDDQSLTEVTEKALLRVNETEDQPMVQAIQDEIGSADFWSLKPVLLMHDTGPVKVRRAIDRLVAADSASSE